MFLGEYRHTIDDKGRLTIPAKHRALFAPGMVITRGLDRNLLGYTLEGWDELAARIKNLPITDANSRTLRRRFFSGAVDLTPDKQGRILLPPYLRDFAGIESEAVISGMFDYIEIWSDDTWQPVRENIEGDDSSWQDLGI